MSLSALPIEAWGWGQGIAFLKAWSGCERAYKLAHQPQLHYRKKARLTSRLTRGAEACIKKEKTKKAIFILEKLLKIERNPSPSSKKWQRQLADLSFYKIKDYEKALKHYTDLSRQVLGTEERFFVQYHIAESFFYLKKYSQALREADKCFFDGISQEKRKQALNLKGRSLMAEGRFDLAKELFERQIEQFPEESAFLREYLAFIYESQKDFSSAIKELEKIHPSNPFIRGKINRLMERRSHQPGF